MSDHDFEKKVQQKMDDLRLRPSDAVWAGVERDLRRDKRRRRVALWLPLMGLLLTAGGYFIFTAPGNKGQDTLAKTAPVQKTGTPGASASSPAASNADASAPASETASAVKPHDPKNIGPSSPSSPDQKNHNESPVSNSSQKTDNTPTVSNSTQKDNKSSSGNTTKSALQNDNVASSPATNEPVLHKNKTAAKMQGDKQPAGPLTVANKKSPGEQVTNLKDKPKLTDKDITGKKPVQKDINDKEEAPKTIIDSNAIVSNNADMDAADPKADKNEVDSSAIAGNKQDAEAGKSLDKKSATPAVARNTPKKKQPSVSKWQWGVNANAGMASISEGSLLDVLKSVRVDDLTGALPQYNGIPPVPSPEPSAIRPGLAFSIGAFVQRNFSKRFSISAGLQYSYFSVNTSIGRKVDSAVAVNYGVYYSQVASNVYRADNMVHDYTNRYHFIELPLTASYRIIRSKKFPLVLDAGLSFSRLLGTNALHYDGISRVYYENDDFFKKMQVSMNTGLNVGFFQASRHPLWIGPSLRYFTTGLIKREVSASDEGQHIWSFGLNAKMLLKK